MMRAFPSSATDDSAAPVTRIAAESFLDAARAYGQWRSSLAASIDTYRDWLKENELDDAQVTLRLARLTEQLNEDRLAVAFVAEKPNDTSDLINAVFVSAQGTPLLPSGALAPGCPTELRCDKDKLPCIELLPIETRALDASGADSRRLVGESDAIVFVLGPAPGDSDLELWRDRIANAAGTPARGLAVLNKVDALAPEQPSAAEVESEIGPRLDACARILALPRSRVFAVSELAAHRAKTTGDAALLERSRLPQLERALASGLVTNRQSASEAMARAELDDLVAGLRVRLDADRRGVLEQLRELEYLRGKNRGLVAAMTQRIRTDREEFERGLARFQALRGVFSAHSDRLYTHLGLDALAEEWQRTREEILRAAFTPGVRSAMSRYFREVRSKLDRSAVEVSEIADLMTVMYRKFSQEHGLRLTTPVAFSMARYVKEIDRIESGYARRFDTPMVMLTNAKHALLQKFFDTLATQVKRCYEYANREVDNWLRAIMAPIETQVHEHQLQIRQRLESIKRIRQATDTLGERIGELEPIERNLRRQLEALVCRRSELEDALGFGRVEPRRPE